MDYANAAKIAAEIVGQMTVEEKISQLLYEAPAVERLGINEYNWWNEAAHGVARSGTATVFPHAIALAATFDPQLVFAVADAVSTEGRAKYNENIRQGVRDIYKGLTFWAPNINIFRDPRWGRGQETYGEDPFLTATLASEYIKGIQGSGEFLKASACSKHFAVHSGPEKNRHSFDSAVSDKDLFETYLPAFEKTVKSGVTGVMGAYNRVNGVPCCANERLLGEILRKKWGYSGYVVSDCGAIHDISHGHAYKNTDAEAAACALKAGCDLNCGKVYKSLIDAYEEDLVTEEDITKAAVRLYTIRAMLGEFEEDRPYSDIPYSAVDCKKHRQLNLNAARECAVLLKNENNFLPLDKNTEMTIAVVGPNAVSVTALEGNYNGQAAEYVTVADGIRKSFPDADIKVSRGSRITDRVFEAEGVGNWLSDGVAAARNSDIAVLCLGLDRLIEGEDTGESDDYSISGDKKGLFLPETQIKLAEAVCDACENVIVILMAGSSVDPGKKVRDHAKAILQLWYPGALGGKAAGEILSGAVSPCGKLPVTVYDGNQILPDFGSFDMAGRTYRYIECEPLYPFGFGLTYTHFSFGDFIIDDETDESITVSVDIKNDGGTDSYEKIQLYASFTDSRTKTPHYQLCSIKPVYLAAGEKTRVALTAEKYWLKAVLENGERVTPDGKITLYIGAHQPDKKSTALCGDSCLELELK